jgi:uncharacterized protein DUF998
MRKNRRLAMSAATLGPAVFGAAAIAGARRLPGYRHRDEPISAIAAKNSGASPLMVAGFLGLGLGTFVLGDQLRGTRVPKTLPTAMRIAGVTTALAGIARNSDRSCPIRSLGDENATISDDLHGVFSAMTFALWISMPLTAAIRGTRLRPAYRRRSALLGAATLGAFVATGVLAGRRAETWGGAAQRAMVASALAWLPVIAGAAFSAG